QIPTEVRPNLGDVSRSDGGAGAGNISYIAIVLRVKSSNIREGEDNMKRTLFIILGVVAVFLVIGIAFTNMVMQRAPSQDSYLVSPGFGGSGGGAPESVAPP